MNASWSKLSVAYVEIFFFNLAVTRRVYDIIPSSTVVTLRSATCFNSKVFYFAPHIVLKVLVRLLEQAADTLNRINRFTFVRKTLCFVCEKINFHKLCQVIRALSG